MPLEHDICHFQGVNPQTGLEDGRRRLLCGQPRVACTAAWIQLLWAFDDPKWCPECKRLLEHIYHIRISGPSAFDAMHLEKAGILLPRNAEPSSQSRWRSRPEGDLRHLDGLSEACRAAPDPRFDLESEDDGRRE